MAFAVFNPFLSLTFGVAITLRDEELNKKAEELVKSGAYSSGGGTLATTGKKNANAAVKGNIFYRCALSIFSWLSLFSTLFFPHLRRSDNLARRGAKQEG